MTVREQLRDCLYRVYLYEKNNHFWEQFAEHSIIAISFMGLGFILGMLFLRFAFNDRIMMDYEIPKGTMIKVENKGKRWLIIRPNSFVQLLDAIIISYTKHKDGKHKHVSVHDKRRARIITIVLLVFILLFAVSGVILLLSAFAWSLNPFDYIWKNMPVEELW